MQRTNWIERTLALGGMCHVCRGRVHLGLVEATALLQLLVHVADAEEQDICVLQRPLLATGFSALQQCLEGICVAADEENGAGG